MSKKTVEVIIETNNDYVIGVKGNQPKLKEKIQKNLAVEREIVSFNQRTERVKGRIETRTVYVSHNLTGISKNWVGLKSIVRVERKRIIKGKIQAETAFYLTSLDVSAEIFNAGIRGHWGIENGLHFVKDGTFKEDASKINSGNSAANFSIIRNIVINIFRKMGRTNMLQEIRLHCNDIRKMAKII